MRVLRKRKPLSTFHRNERPNRDETATGRDLSGKVNRHARLAEAAGGVDRPRTGAPSADDSYVAR